ncbi:receptor-like protein 46 [Salvia splendens]|uniref:receptor-like protein 46 n=1 Tax=Salvia splendens TaxID=180675 RepID=UPI001C26658E|nr:receptor-like protein 46 [Salvia splendens]
MTGHWGSPPSLQLWNSTSFMCAWPEVDCVFGSVTGLTLAEKNIRGTIPPKQLLKTSELGLVHERTVWDNPSRAAQPLWLHGNRLVGTIPTQIEALRLEENFLNGTIPTDLFQLRLLEYLSLGYNALSGKLPEQVQVYRLEVLNLTHNNLHGTVPKSITDLTRIHTFDLSDNELSGDVESVVHLRSMTAVRLCSNKFSGKVGYEIVNEFFHEN